LIPQDHNSAHRDQRWIAILNVGSTTIPPFGVCEVVDSYRPESGTVVTPSGGITVLKVQRPSEAEPCNWVVNWSCEIPVGETGIGTKDSPMNALVDSAGYVSGDVVGVESGSYALTEGKCGFVVDGDYDATYQCMRVTRLDDCPDEMMVMAIECSYPGQSASAQPMTWDDVTCNWIEDTSRSPITIDDPMCWRMALPNYPAGTGGVYDGELYEVRRPGGWCSTSSCNWIPARPFGLKRRIKIQSEIDCGATGKAYVMRNISGGGTGAGACDWANLDNCEIDVCNTSNRKIGCDANEDATAFWMEGECVAWLIPDQRPMTATATLTQNMCADDLVNVTISPGSIAYKDVCAWTTRDDVEDVDNPHKLLACSGDEVLLYWNNDDCRWKVKQVEHHTQTIVTSVGCALNSCALEVQTIDAQIMLCCEETETDRTIIGEEITALVAADSTCNETGEGTGSSLTTCYLSFTTKTFCVIGCKESEPSAVETVFFEKVEVLEDAEFYQNGLELTLDKWYREMCVLCVDAQARPDTDVVEGIDCSDTGGGTGGTLQSEGGLELTTEDGDTIIEEGA